MFHYPYRVVCKLVNVSLLINFIYLFIYSSVCTYCTTRLVKQTLKQCVTVCDRLTRTRIATHPLTRSKGL